jgi:D-alanyl-D-alanine carboxypeptidase
MTHTARRLGMPRTSFANASGLPNPAQVTTARDMATLGLRLMRDFPQYYPYFRTRSFVFQGRTIKGHNRLLGKFEGTDGIKTGYINASGFNLVSSVRRGDKRLVGVVLGGKTGKSRDAYMRKMLDRQFAKASSGKAIAALAGSPKGAIDPLASAGTATAASPEATVRKPKSSIFGKKKEEPPVSGSQVAEADPAVTEAPTEEGDTDDAPAMGALAEAAQQAAAPGQEEPKSSTAAADPAVLSVPDPANVPFEVKSPEEQAADAKIVATLAVDHSWSIQIGSYASKRDAQARLQEMRRQIGIPLAGKTALTVAVQKNTAVTYRARFTGFSQGEAQSTCDEMAKLKAECQVLAPQS